MNRVTQIIFIAITILIGNVAYAAQLTNRKNNRKVEKRHFTFKLREDVTRQKVSFKNRFGITISGDLYYPNNIGVGEKLPAIAVSGPFGAVKEQSSGFYANEMASRGFIALAFDPSFTGESGGEVRDINSPDINTEDFSAAVDYLSMRDDVSASRIGIIGICGWGGIALNAAAIDTRIRAIATFTMYDMSRVMAYGYNDAVDAKGRAKLREELNRQCLIDISNGTNERAGGVIDPLPDDAPQFIKDYHDYHKTPRGYHENSVNSNAGWVKTSALSYMNTRLLAFADEIEVPVLGAW